jgi:hypothetical protein
LNYLIRSAICCFFFRTPYTFWRMSSFLYTSRLSSILAFCSRYYLCFLKLLNTLTAVQYLLSCSAYCTKGLSFIHLLNLSIHRLKYKFFSVFECVFTSLEDFFLSNFLVVLFRCKCCITLCLRLWLRFYFKPYCYPLSNYYLWL